MPACPDSGRVGAVYTVFILSSGIWYGLSNCEALAALTLHFATDARPKKII